MTLDPDNAGVGTDSLLWARSEDWMEMACILMKAVEEHWGHYLVMEVADRQTIDERRRIVPTKRWSH